MAKSKLRTPAQKTTQKIRTSRNKVKKYSKLLEKYPNSPHTGIWQEQIKFNA